MKFILSLKNNNNSFEKVNEFFNEGFVVSSGQWIWPTVSVVRHQGKNKIGKICFFFKKFYDKIITVKKILYILI